MKKTKIQIPEIKLVGITARTNNKAEFDPATAQITPTGQKYFGNGLADMIINRKNPMTTFCAYTDYESDHTGDYTFFIGEEVSSLDNIPEGMESHIIQPQTYIKFTTESAPLPAVVINAWQEIWKMDDQDLGGKRRYHADFELYDVRARDYQNAVLDIFIGIE